MDALLKKDLLNRKNSIIQYMQANSVLILASANIQIRNQDNEYTFRQNSNFYYLTGFKEPNSIFIIRKDGDNNTKSILFNLPKDKKAELWTGARLGQEAAQEELSVDHAYSITSFDEYLIQYIKDAEHIYYDLGNENLDKKIILAINSCSKKHLAPKDVNKKIVPILQQISKMRVQKSDYEIQQMQIAADIACKAHIRAIKHAKPGLYEYHLHAEILHTFLQHGAIEPSYPPIVAAGNNACILHYTQNNTQIQDGDLILIDAGCESEYYASDITRTFPANKQFKAEQQSIYELVLNAQYAGIKAAQVGKAYTDIQDSIVDVIVTGLCDLKLLQGNKAQLIKDKAYNKFYMHRSGHWLGLDVHDIGTYTDDAENSITLKENMALTIEPGIYIQPSLQDIPEKFRGIGVRIEDDIIIKKNEPLVMSTAAPKTIEDMKNL